MRQLNYTARSTVMMHFRRRFLVPGVRPRSYAAIGVVVAVIATLAGCKHKEAPAPPVAKATVTLNHDKAPLGSPVEITYKFVVQSGATFDGNYKVMLHVLDADDQLIWTDDHDPSVPTSQWKAGQTVEYTRTVFIPIYPYVGEASLQIGLYSPTNQKRLPLDGEDTGQRAYRAGKLQLQPQTANVFTVFKEGWHQAESVVGNTGVEWQWTKKQATLAFKNPKHDVVFYLDTDNPGGPFTEMQQVRVTLGEHVLADFQVTPGAPQVLRKIPISGEWLGAGDMNEIQIAVDKTFVPLTLTNGASKDYRELGVRVFHAFIAP